MRDRRALPSHQKAVSFSGSRSCVRLAARTLVTTSPTVFISHASEDGDTVAVPLAERLRERGITVWIDQWQLALGDSLRTRIEAALSQSAFGVVIISPDYMRKVWTNRELDGLFSLETPGRNVILPVLHNVSHAELSERWPILANRVNCATDRGLQSVADEIARVCLSAGAAPRREPPAGEILSAYRRRLLEAVDANELLELQYELEDFLRRHPAHPQGRSLHDRVTAAVRHTAPPRPADFPNRALPRSRGPLAAYALAVGAMAVLAVALLVMRPGSPYSAGPAATASPGPGTGPSLLVVRAVTVARRDGQIVVNGRSEGSLTAFVLTRPQGRSTWDADKPLVQPDGTWTMQIPAAPGLIELYAIAAAPGIAEAVLGEPRDGTRLPNQLSEEELLQLIPYAKEIYPLSVLR